MLRFIKGIQWFIVKLLYTVNEFDQKTCWQWGSPERPHSDTGGLGDTPIQQKHYSDLENSSGTHSHDKYYD